MKEPEERSTLTRCVLLLTLASLVLDAAARLAELAGLVGR